MTERPNVPVLKTGVGLPTVGSNPTPSAQGRDEGFCVPSRRQNLGRQNLEWWTRRGRLTTRSDQVTVLQELGPTYVPLKVPFAATRVSAPDSVVPETVNE
jgi:hypothetical protein